MKLSVSFQDHTNSSELIGYIESKIRFALGAHTHRLSNGELRLRQEQTAEGKIAHCSLNLKSDTHGIIHVAESGENEYAAISKSLRVAASKLRRTAERRKDNGRRRGRAGKRLLFQDNHQINDPRAQHESVDASWDVLVH